MSLIGAALVISGFCLLGWQGWGESKAMRLGSESRTEEEEWILERDREAEDEVED